MSREGTGAAMVALGICYGLPVPILTRLRKSDRRIFHTKASLQKLSAKVGSARMARSLSMGTMGTVCHLAVPIPSSPCRWRSTQSSGQGCRMSTC